MATPHNQAKKGDFASTVIMPGDPKRAKFIAQNYLQDAKLVNDVRGVQGYTGFFRGKRVSVMASGMGMPSIAIYAHELYEYYDVNLIIRAGSAGGIADDVNLRDIVIAQAACTDSNFLQSKYRFAGQYSPIGDYETIKKAEQIALKKGFKVRVGNILSTDVFYSDTTAEWQKTGVLAVEMECAALYAVAAEHGKKALCICTVSDCPLKGLSLPAQERQTGFTDMMEIALETAE